MDNQVTPDVSSGHGQQTPDVSSGHGANVNGNSSQIQSQAGNNNQNQPDWRTEFEKQRNHSNAKITELAQANAKYQQDLEAIRQQQEAQKNAFAQAFGFGNQQQQNVDYFEQFAQNPNSIMDWISQKAEEIANQKVQPIAEKITRAEMNEYLQYQDSQKQQLRSELAEQYDPKIVEEVMNFTDVLDPKVVQSQDYAAIAKEIQRLGGVETIVNLKLGKYLRNNQQSLMRSAAQIYQQKTLQSQRSRPLPGYTGGGQQQSSGFGTNARSESVYR